MSKVEIPSKELETRDSPQRENWGQACRTGSLPPRGEIQTQERKGEATWRPKLRTEPLYRKRKRNRERKICLRGRGKTRRCRDPCLRQKECPDGALKSCRGPDNRDRWPLDLVIWSPVMGWGWSADAGVPGQGWAQLSVPWLPHSLLPDPRSL